ncbi:GNAT family N-acetyltransferase [Chengkuizengella axinellae]|uniref:GNAT family N-acetyltransferase n=1 Tax=Chengkuizengella axinellae TaxID=3064388 RepID=A0ABT9J1R8_9BACL|nr:GNAT family N-acetyltransferase [Chengkuizengella sp. 2205SS18-9]MDP5275560.1 GNAT family N-acetyltransferase [Chengkuizengella sp. 2205SS18-9]
MEVKVVSTEQELKDAYKVRMDVFVVEQKVPEEIEIDEFENEAKHIVIYDEKKPVATGRIREVDGYGKLERICVLKSHRKYGLGKMIMDNLEMIGHDIGLKQFKLNAQTQAEPFYEKQGYHTVSGEFLDANIPHVTMVKK